MLLLKILLGIIFFYLGMGLLLFLFQERFLFYPSPLSPSQREYLKKFYSVEDIEVKAPDGVHLRGWLSRAPDYQNKPLLLYYGGNGEQVWQNLEDLPKYGDVSLLLMNYRGYGDSEGKPSQQKLFSDALLIYDKMVEEYGYDSKKVILMGRSLGTGIAIHVADRRKVRALILVSPYDSLANVGQKAYPLFPVKLLLRHRFDSRSLAPKLEVPALALAAKQDSIVPLEFTQNLVSLWKGPIQLVVIPGTDHNDIHLSGLYWEALQEFLAQHGES